MNSKQSIQGKKEYRKQSEADLWGKVLALNKKRKTLADITEPIR